MKSPALTPIPRWFGAIMVLASVAACQRFEGVNTMTTPANGGQDAIAAVPLGDLAGAAVSTSDNSIVNPYARDAQAIREGQKLFVKMNCAGCHGYDAQGGMGPKLTDTYWRYGGAPVAIYKSIAEGRPQGMPAWKSALPPQEIWKLVAYIASLGGAFTAEQYQASIQGDHSGDKVAAEVQPTLSGAAPAPASAAKNADAVSPQGGERR